MLGAPRLITAASLKVDEVDGRSPVERAAATFVPDLRRHCARRTMKSGIAFSAALRSFQD